MKDSTEVFGEQQSSNTFNRLRCVLASFLISFLLVFLCAPALLQAQAAAPKAKKTPPAKAEVSREPAVSDSNIQAQLKKAQDLFKNKNYDAALKPYQDIYDYTKEVLPLVKFMRGQYDKAVNQPSLAQTEKEEAHIKLKRSGQLIAKYESIHGAVLYPLGFIYAKKGAAEKAKHYLKEAVETLPFSLKTESTWMKSKNLLLSLYQLEGEF